MDDFFLHVERSGLPMHVGSLAIYDASTADRGRPDFARIRASIWRGVRRTPVLRRRLLNAPLHADRPYWVDAREIDLDYHVRRVALPALGSTPEDVAAAITAAIHTREPRLRTLVGRDAETVVAHRARMTDEEFVAMGRCASDEEFYASFEHHFGIDVRVSLPDATDSDA
jgi:hypothetical protein